MELHKEIALCCCFPRKLFSVWERPWRKGLYFIHDLFDNISKVCFFHLEAARCFYGTFSQINFRHFSWEALSLPSAFVYFAAVSLLVPTACQTFCSRKWNSMLVLLGQKQFVPQTTEFLLNQPPQNTFWIIWLTQLQSKFSIMDP